MPANLSPHSRSLLPIFLLSAGGFTVLTTEFVIIGLLPLMAKDLHVSVSRAGLLVTLFAVTVGVVGPLLTARLAQYERKTLFVFTMLLFAFSNAVAALSPNLAVMAFARIIPALMLPVFWALASETAVRIIGTQDAGKAVSMVNFGLVGATIFGIPLGTLISDRFGWRTAFAAIAVLALAKAILFYVFLPAIPGNQERISVWRQMGILRQPRVLGHVLLSLLVYAGMFTAYTYLAEILEKLGGYSGTAVGWILMGFGGVGLIGNWLGGRLVDRDPLRASILFCAVLAISLALFTSLITSPAFLSLGLAVWGTCHAALFTVSHTRVMKVAGSAPALGASLNVSGANFGIALGAFVGGRVIELAGLGKVSSAAAVIVALAIVAAAFPRLARSRKHPAITPAFAVSSLA